MSILLTRQGILNVVPQDFKLQKSNCYEIPVGQKQKSGGQEIRLQKTHVHHLSMKFNKSYLRFSSMSTYQRVSLN